MDQDRDEFQEIREFWAVFCSIHSTKGIDLALRVQSWVNATRESLSKRAAETSFDELCAAGCSPVSLTIALWAIRTSEHAAEKWRDTIGSTRQRDQIIRTLKKSADVLEALNERFIDVMLRDARLALDEGLRESLSADSTQSPLQTNVEWPAYSPAPDPAIVVRALRLYARALGMFEAIAEETQAHSRESFPRYLISAYVKRSTNSFHDREVSEMIGSTLGTATYDEAAHRMWRRRNYKKLEKSFSSLVDLLFGIGMVVSPKA